MPPPCSTQELLAVVLARDLADGERAIIGTNSDIQLAACNLARRMQAPDLWWVSGPGGMVNPDLGRLISTADHDNVEAAEAWLDLPDMIDFIDWQVHFFDFAILSAIQVDRFGNLNTVAVGDHGRPKLRGPGTVGISALTGLSKRFYVLMSRHDRQALLHPGVTLDAVVKATGFELVVEGAPFGAHSTASASPYRADNAHPADYMKAAAPERFAAYLDRYVQGTLDHAAYLDCVGGARLAALGTREVVSA